MSSVSSLPESGKIYRTAHPIYAWVTDKPQACLRHVDGVIWPIDTAITIALVSPDDKHRVCVTNGKEYAWVDTADILPGGGVA